MRISLDNRSPTSSFRIVSIAQFIPVATYLIPDRRHEHVLQRWRNGANRRLRQSGRNQRRGHGLAFVRSVAADEVQPISEQARRGRREKLLSAAAAARRGSSTRISRIVPRINRFTSSGVPQASTRP